MTLASAVAVLLAGGPPEAAAATELIVRPGETIDATVDGRPARLLVQSGRLDRLTLDEDYVAANRIKPAVLMGKANLELAGRREFKGRNGPVDLTVAGRTKHARAFWFDAAPDSGADGRVGPWGLPQDRVTFTLAPPVAGEALSRAPMYGGIDSASYTGLKVGDGGMGISFDVDDPEAYPVASAAAGALLARTFGGQLSGASWEVEILMGVKRPVRLLTLAKPLTVGPLAFAKIAVRVRDRIDAGGRGREIADADAPVDPSEVLVEGVAKKGQRVLYTLSIPHAGLQPCSRITYDKAAKVIELTCRPAG